MERYERCGREDLELVDGGPVSDAGVRYEQADSGRRERSARVGRDGELVPQGGGELASANRVLVAPIVEPRDRDPVAFGAGVESARVPLETELGGLDMIVSLTRDTP